MTSSNTVTNNAFSIEPRLYQSDCGVIVKIHRLNANSLYHGNKEDKFYGETYLKFGMEGEISGDGETLYFREQDLTVKASSLQETSPRQLVESYMLAREAEAFAWEEYNRLVDARKSIEFAVFEDKRLPSETPIVIGDREILIGNEDSENYCRCYESPVTVTPVRSVSIDDLPF